MKPTPKQVEWANAVLMMMVDNFPAAHIMNQCKGPNDSILEFWHVEGNGMMIVQYWKDGGFEYYCIGYEGKMNLIPDDIRYSLGISFKKAV